MSGKEVSIQEVMQKIKDSPAGDSLLSALHKVLTTPPEKQQDTSENVPEEVRVESTEEKSSSEASIDTSSQVTSTEFIDTPPSSIEEKIEDSPASPQEVTVEDETVGESTDIQVIKTDDFWPGLIRGAVHKAVESFTSVKVWFFIWPFILSGFLLHLFIYKVMASVTLVLQSHLDVDAYTFVTTSFSKITEMYAGWLSFIVALVGSIIVVRETFKIGKVNILAKQDVDEAKKINN